jgi:hypothetical protein
MGFTHLLLSLLVMSLVLWTSPCRAERLLFRDDFDDGVISDEWTIPDTGLEPPLSSCHFHAAAGLR